MNANSGAVSIQNNSTTSALGALTLTADGQVSILDTSLARGGSVFINTANNPSGPLTVNGTIQSGSAAGDATVVTSTGALTVVGTGSWINPTALSISANGNLDLSGSTAPTLTNNLTLTATGGILKIPGNQFTVSQGAGGTGGTITITANTIQPADITSPINFTADGTSTGKGGTISVTLSNASETIGGGANQLNFSAQGGTISGGGGSVTVSNTGDLIVNSAQLAVAPQASGNGGKIFLTAGATNTLTINASSLSEDGVITGLGASGGEIQLSAGIITGNGSQLTLSAMGVGIGDGGTVSYSSNSAAVVVGGLANGAIIITAAAGSGGGNGGIVTVNSGTGNLTFNAIYRSW